MIDEDTIIQNMLMDGGSFAKALARAFQLADSDNKQRIRDGWKDYWQRYSYERVAR